MWFLTYETFVMLHDEWYGIIYSINCILLQILNLIPKINTSFCRKFYYLGVNQNLTVLSEEQEVMYHLFHKFYEPQEIPFVYMLCNKNRFLDFHLAWKFHTRATKALKQLIVSVFLDYVWYARLHHRYFCKSTSQLFHFECQRKLFSFCFSNHHILDYRHQGKILGSRCSYRISIEYRWLSIR